MRAVVAVTDNDWAAFLRDRPNLTEANFWFPSPRAGFRALKIGEPFLFKTHWPDNRLVGGGFFSGFDLLSADRAWRLFGEGNGVSSLAQLIARISRYRRAPASATSEIGCVMLRDLFFAPPGQSLSAPEDFSPNIVRYKSYDFGGESSIETRLEALLEGSELRIDDLTGTPLVVPGATRGVPHLTVPRLGQRAFKSMVLTSYHRRCAVTGNRVEPVLQAAHIRPVAAEGQHRVDNGLLLRSDVHILFDEGYLGIDDRYRLHVSPRLRGDFGNGDEFYRRAGSTIDVPDNRADRPSAEAIAWHMDVRFRR